ncbi:hypothetical protein [Aliiglaciecola aliphaticivorans]
MTSNCGLRAKARTTTKHLRLPQTAAYGLKPVLQQNTLDDVATAAYGLKPVLQQNTLDDVKLRPTG